MAAGVALALQSGAALGAEISAQPPEQRFVPGEVLVRYEPGTSVSERASLRSDSGLALERRLSLPRVELLEIEDGRSVQSAVAALERRTEVLYAEPNFILTPEAVPDDTDFGQLWGMNNTGQTVNGTTGVADADIDAPEAWDDQTGSSGIVVGVVDSGIAYDHPDLDGNIWANPGEESDGMDNDGNGKVDDLRGWDWFSADNDPYDIDHGHGTHVAGTLGAEGNNAAGVTGVTQDVSMMVLRACNMTSCPSAAVADAFTYAGQEGAEVVNASLSGSGNSATIEAAVRDARETLFVVAAGNDSRDNDVTPQYPCNYDLPNLICVAASNASDNLASFTNFGDQSVDIAAPGTSTWSTYPFRTIWTENFETPLLGNWTTTGAWGLDAYTASSPIHSLADTPRPGPGLPVPGGPVINYTNNSDTLATKDPPVDLSGRTGCQLRYAALIDTEAGADLFKAEAATDLMNPFAELSSRSGNTNATFTDDLTAFSGNPTVYLRFRLVTNGSVVDDGVYVDDVRIRCIDPGQLDSFAFLSGTSMATPHVAGAAALLLAEQPGADPAQLRTWLLDGADPKPLLASKLASGSRLNVRRALDGALGADVDRPQTTITSPPPAPSPETSATFSFTADEASTFKCKLDAGAFAPCTSPITFSGLTVGQHTLSVFATDTAGNDDLTAASQTFTVTAPPVVTPPPPDPVKPKCKKRKKPRKGKKKKRCVKR